MLHASNDLISSISAIASEMFIKELGIRLNNLSIIEPVKGYHSCSMRISTSMPDDILNYARKRLEISNVLIDSSIYNKLPWTYYIYVDIEFDFTGSKMCMRDQILHAICTSVIAPLKESLDEYNFDKEVDKLLLK